MTNACPDTAQLSLFIDGVLRDEERARVAGHVNTCERCYLVVRESLVLESEQAERKPGRLLIFWKSPLVILPLAAVLLLGVASVLLLSRAHSRLDPVEIAALLPQEPFQLPERAPAFAGTATPQTLAFETGSRMLHIEMAAQLHDGIDFRSHCQAVSEALKTLGSPANLVASYQASARAGSALLPGITTPLYRTLRESPQGVFVDLGLFSEAGWIAASHHRGGVVSGTEARRLLRELPEEKTPPGVLKSLKQIESLSKREPAAPDWAGLEREFLQIRRVYLQ